MIFFTASPKVTNENLCFGSEVVVFTSTPRATPLVKLKLFLIKYLIKQLLILDIRIK